MVLAIDLPTLLRCQSTGEGTVLTQAPSDLGLIEECEANLFPEVSENL